ncbi:MAG: hypothetical protein AAGH64_03070 [Planctomycetota bacterium]
MTARFFAPLCVLLAPTVTHADLLIWFSPAPGGGGGTRVAITGSIDIPGSTRSVLDQSVEDRASVGVGAGGVAWWNFAEFTPGPPERRIAGSDNTMPIWNIRSVTTASGLGLAGVFLLADPALSIEPGVSGYFLIVRDETLANPVVLDEEIVYDDIPFAGFNAGEWNFGAFGGTPNDGVRVVVDEQQTLCAGDLDGDGAVGLSDFGLLGAAFGSVTGDANYDAGTDFDMDGDVDLGDFAVFAQGFGRTDC